MKALIFVILSLISMTALATEVRILSMNMHCALGEWQKRTLIVVEEIIRLNPDVIGFQEICKNNDVDMKEFIWEELNKRSYFESRNSIRTHRTFIKYHEELFIVAKVSSDKKFHGKLPAVPTLENMYLGLEIDGISFITTHFHFALPHIRRKQYEALSSFTPQKTIVFGDMNSNPGNSEALPFIKDGWMPVYGGPTYPSHKPSKTFDGFWLSPAMKTAVTNVKIERLFLNAKTQPSDHLGLLMTLEIIE